MNQTIEERILNIEDRLKEVRKELEKSLARYKDKSWLSKDIPQYIPITPEQFQKMIDQLWEDDK